MLTGDRKGTWSLHVTRNRRLTFRIEDDEIEAAVVWAEGQPEPRCEDLLEGVYA